MRVLVLGGGYGGVTLARKLESALADDHELVVVDEDGTHLLQHELHRVVREPSLAGELTVALDAVLDRASIVEARVEAVRADDRTVALADGTELSYDVCAVCLGAEPALSVPGVREHATPLKRIEHARAIHERAVEVLDAVDPDGEGGAWPPSRIVVGGAGLSGVQVAGELAALAGRRDREVGEDVEIVVLEQADAVAPGFDGPFQAAIQSALVERGVEVRTGARVERATTDAVHLATDADGDLAADAAADRAGSAGSSRIEHDLLVWTGGIAGSSALGDERPQVDARLRLTARTFALGDAVRAVDRDGQGVPATAQAAVRQADTVATNVQRTVEGSDGTFDPRLERFAFDSPGWVVSVGDGAVAQVGPTVFTGRAATALKTTVGVGYLSSVGALREAVDVVNAELGLDVDED